MRRNYVVTEIAGTYYAQDPVTGQAVSVSQETAGLLKANPGYRVYSINGRGVAVLDQAGNIIGGAPRVRVPVAHFALPPIDISEGAKVSAVLNGVEFNDSIPNEAVSSPSDLSIEGPPVDPSIVPNGQYWGGGRIYSPPED